MNVENVITGALRVAAEQYGNDAARTNGNERLREQFKRQANEAEQLALAIKEHGLSFVVRNGVLS